MFPVAAVAVALLATGAPANGEDIVRAMHDKYAGKWYQTATFVQKTTFPETNRVETWYEAMTVPGKLRIDIAPLDSGSAILFRSDSVYRVIGGKVARARDFVHPLMILGFDVYADPAERTIARLKGLGFDLSQMHEDTWQGRPVYVVGAASGDLKAKQFWVDKERLYFVRMLEPDPQNGERQAETQFNKYQPVGKGWMSVEVLFTVGGKLQQKEEYGDVRADVNLPAGLFEPSPWQKAEWIGAK